FHSGEHAERNAVGRKSRHLNSGPLHIPLSVKIRIRKNTAWLQYSAALLLLIAAAALFVYRQHALLERVGENVAFFFDRAPERAFSYGEKHFDARNPQEYDIERAKYFFFEALRHDPKYPMAHYQLARIAFLKSDFP